MDINDLRTEERHMIPLPHGPSEALHALLIQK